MCGILFSIGDASATVFTLSVATSIFSSAAMRVYNFRVHHITESIVELHDYDGP